MQVFVLHYVCPYQMVERLRRYVHSFRYITTMWRTDGQTDKLLKTIVLSMHCMLTRDKYTHTCTSQVTFVSYMLCCVTPWFWALTFWLRRLTLHQKCHVVNVSTKFFFLILPFHDHAFMIHQCWRFQSDHFDLLEVAVPLSEVCTVRSYAMVKELGFVLPFQWAYICICTHLGVPESVSVLCTSAFVYCRTPDELYVL